MLALSVRPRAQLTHDQLDVYLVPVVTSVAAAHVASVAQPAPVPVPPPPRAAPAEASPHAGAGAEHDASLSRSERASAPLHAEAGEGELPVEERTKVGISATSGGRWKAEIRLPLPPGAAPAPPEGGKAPTNRRQHLGTFASAREAAEAYDAAARKHGKAVNFPAGPHEVAAQPRKPPAPKVPAAVPGNGPFSRAFHSAYPALDAQRRALAAAERHASTLQAPTPAETSPPVEAPPPAAAVAPVLPSAGALAGDLRQADTAAAPAAQGACGDAAAPAAPPARRFRGVSYVDGKWVATIYVSRDNAALVGLPGPKQLRLGAFESAEAAACAYDDMARRMPSFTHFNFPRAGTAEAQAVPVEVSAEAQRAAAARRAEKAAAAAAGLPLPAAARKRKNRPAASPDAAPAAAAVAAAQGAAPCGDAADASPAVKEHADDELRAALVRNGLAHLVARFATERLDAPLLRTVGASFLRRRTTLERLGVPDTIGDRLRLALALRDVGVADAMTLAEPDA